jgi:hypothetical protein
VQFGGIKVGGIRISHMSHIDREMEMALTVTKAKRTPYTGQAAARRGVRQFQALQAEDETLARRLEAALKGRAKALASRR